MARTGFLDAIDGDVLWGWAYDDESRESPRIAVRIEGLLVDEFVGTEFRADLLAAEIGTGHHGFTYTIPDRWRSSTVVVLSLTFADTGRLLTHGERVVLNGGLAKCELFQGVLSTGIWQPEAFDRSDTTITVSGWAIPPFAVPIPFAIAHNGVIVEQMETFERPEILQRFGIPHQLKQVGFRLAVDVPQGSDSGNHEFAFVEKRTGKPFNRRHSIYQLPALAPIPDDARRMRVGRTNDLEDYLRVGSTILTQLDQIAVEYADRSFAQAEAILDWGCGCGRVFQFLPPEHRARLTGIDIDPDNIGWCRENFPEGRFETVSLRPPTNLPSEHYDLVFSISVLTHLTEERQFEWLEEVRRITRPGALILISVHGETAWVNGGSSLARYAEWRAAGFLIVGKNHDLDDATVDGSEYYNSFVTRSYIFEQWSKYFSVVDVVAGAIATQQDLVVLRRQ